MRRKKNLHRENNMALTPPHWAKDAIPTPRGWVKNNELLVSTKISQADIDVYYGVNQEPVVEVLVEPIYYEENNERMDIIGQNGNDGLHYTEVQQLNEVPSYSSMTKAQLLVLAEEKDIEVPKYATKAGIIELLQ